MAIDKRFYIYTLASLPLLSALFTIGVALFLIVMLFVLLVYVLAVCRVFNKLLILPIVRLCDLLLS